MRTILILLTPLALAACIGAPAPEPEPPVVLGPPPPPAEILSLIPDGIEPGAVRQRATGCWVYEFEGLDVPVTRGGTPVCG
jgi:hypothetical protein